MSSGRVAVGRVLTDTSSVRDDSDAVPSTSYSEYSLTQCLQFLGCKPRRSQKVARKVFWLLTERERVVDGQSASAIAMPSSTPSSMTPSDRSASDGPRRSCSNSPPGLVLSRDDFEDLVISCLGDHPRHLANAKIKLRYFRSASRVVVEKSKSLVVLLCGTSGTGKSTLASLVASRLGIAHVMSTDVIRNFLRGMDVRRERGYLWKSTYEEGEVGEAEASGEVDMGLSAHYLQQRSAILERAEILVEAFVTRRFESLIMEGVHLSGAFAVRMMERFPHACILPFLVHISNGEKHLERFAVRAKAMTLRPDSNRYVHHFQSIRDIQRALIREAQCLRIPQVDNTNVDRSLTAIHDMVLGVLADGSSTMTRERIDIFAAKDKRRSGKEAASQISAVRTELGGCSPMSSSTSLFTLNELNRDIEAVAVDTGAAGSDEQEGSDENDSEYQDVLNEIEQLGHAVDGSVNTHDETTTQGMSLHE